MAGVGYTQSNVSGLSGSSLAGTPQYSPLPSTPIGSAQDSPQHGSPAHSTAAPSFMAPSMAPTDASQAQKAEKISTDVVYVCGSCSAESTIKRADDPVRCHTCSHRILYKKRTTDPVQFQAI
eukprot:TRINITY_DN66639_c3_g16_i1.p1 TRINITY_DN66639_c3_g16~~TRINITY_DN66639_c3_g16_i1.p1  ORF type:complete len:122 (-),score=4.04 TRINITY_DN66639_c3_g16_i1:149-514(-)